MTNYILLVCLLTAVIHFIGIASLSARIVGTRTKRLASSISIFNIVILISQFSNTIQAPLLAKYVENNLISGNPPENIIFRSIIFSATIGGLLGILAIPTIHRFMEKGVNSLYHNPSVFSVLLKACRLSTYSHIKESITIPKLSNFYRLSNYTDINKKIIFLNVVVYSFITVSVLSCLYAGYLNPHLRSTSLSLSGVANGIGTVGMLLFIEPYNAILTDKVIDGSVTESFFRRHLTFVVAARVLGTVLGQFLYIPLAHAIADISAFI